MRINSEWIQYADKAVHDVGIVGKHTFTTADDEDNENVQVKQTGYAFPSEFKGYISSFAATIVQTGLYPALLIYENESAGAASKRYLLPYAVLNILNQLVLNHKMPPIVNDKKALSWQYHDANDEDQKVLQRNIEKALVALKIVIRMYSPIKGLELSDKGLPSLLQYTPQLLAKPENTESIGDHPNIGWLYYRDYYRDYTLDKYKDGKKEKYIQEYIFKEFKNKRLLSATLTDKLSVNQKIKTELDSKEYLTASFLTTNPGLIIGLGLSHGTSVDNDYKCGFQFDHTSGLPYIPGPAVKGMLRSMFPSIQKKKRGSEYNKDRVNYINELLGFQQSPLSEDDVIQLTDQLFEHNRQRNEPANIFMDALITNGPYKDSDEALPFMSNDFLTPHPTPFSEPSPIEFIKIVPDVEFTFFFKLYPVRIETEDKKLIDINVNTLFTLFKCILLDIGIGAKTDVGYGQLQEIETNQNV